MENSTMRVIDIPANATAALAEELLNRPFDDDYYLVSIVGWDKLSARAFYRRRVHGAEGVRGGLSVKNGDGVLSVKARGNIANRDGKDGAAKAIIRDKQELKIRELVTALKDAGITRSKTWVGDARLELRASARHS